MAFIENASAKPLHSVMAKKGQLSLPGIQWEKVARVPINGDWIIFPDTLIPPHKINQALQQLPYKYISVPSKRKETKNFNYGTYYLKLTETPFNTPITINTLTIYSSARVFINNKLVGKIGDPNYSKVTTQPGLILKTKPYQSLDSIHHIVVQYANFYREKDGIANNIFIVTPQHKLSQSVIQLLKYAIILGTILFIIFNQINYFLLRKSNYTSFFFGLASISIFIYILFMSQYYLSDIFPTIRFNFNIALKTWRTAYYLTVGFFAIYIYHLFPSIYSKKILYPALVYTALSIIVVNVLPFRISSINMNIFMYFTLLIGLHGLIMGVLGKIKRIEDAGLFLFGFGFFLTTVINDILHNLLIIKSINLLDIGIFGMMLTQAQIINTRLNRSLIRSEELSSHLTYMNNNLEGLVLERTEEIEEQKAEIEAQRDEITVQRDFAMKQHRLIAQQKKTITDSINYAKEIQQAVLPDEHRLKRHFSDSFILFKPKDFVSGDFYWIRNFEIAQTPYLAFCVADCTGHGVPGALLSMLGMSLLNEIISHSAKASAAEILELLRIQFKITLASKLKKQASSDGMHITLCLLNQNTGEISYSGAFQALYHIRNNKVYRIKGTHCIIGNYMHELPFVEHKLQLKKDDRLYLFTDGFADQMAENGQGRFMQRRLVNLLTGFDGLPFENQRKLLRKEFEDWRGDYEQIDDVLVLGVKY